MLQRVECIIIENILYDGSNSMIVIFSGPLFTRTHEDQYKDKGVKLFNELVEVSRDFNSHQTQSKTHKYVSTVELLV